jgi:Ran GTPase-activating protein (RanGAP) involved in mRNA processing and transport
MSLPPATSTGSSSPRLPFGLTHEQIRTDMFTAWRKDSREPATVESYKRFRGHLDTGLRDKEVSLRNASIGVNFALCFASLLPRSGVTKLDLHGNMLRDAGAEAVAHIVREASSITHLNLGANDIGAPGITALASVIAGHKKLQTLILGSTGGDTHVNRIDPASAKPLIDACIRCKTLKWLDLNRNPIGRGSQEALMMLTTLIQSSPNLQVLKVGETEMTSDTAIALIASLRKNSTVSELHLHGNNLGFKVGEAIGSLLEDRGRKAVPSCLKTLVLHSNPGLGAHGATAIFRGLTADKGLSTVSLFGCNIDDDGVLALCDSLDCNSTLTSLDLHSNAITQIGAAEIARSVATHPGLQHLSLARNKVQDDGACALAGMLEANKVLDQLDLTECWISDRGAVALGVALAGNSSLHVLKLDHNHITEDGGSALAALLDRNSSLLECGLKGNSIYHNTGRQLSRILNRNTAGKEAEVPNKLKREVVHLHYQLYKLEEARTELQLLNDTKSGIERERDEKDSEFRMRESDFFKQKKQLEDALRDQDRGCKAIDEQLRKLNDEFARFIVENDNEVRLHEERLEAETAERQKAEAEVARLQSEIKSVEAQRQKRVDDLKKQVEEAQQDRLRWIEQTKTCRQRADELQEVLRALESDLAAKEAASGAVVAAPESQKKSGKSQQKASSGAQSSADAINALLGGSA